MNNPIFEPTPVELLRAVVTDTAILPPEAILALCDEVEAGLPAELIDQLLAAI